MESSSVCKRLVGELCSLLKLLKNKYRLPEFSLAAGKFWRMTDAYPEHVLIHPNISLLSLQTRGQHTANKWAEVFPACATQKCCLTYTNPTFWGYKGMYSLSSLAQSLWSIKHIHNLGNLIPFDYLSSGTFKCLWNKTWILLQDTAFLNLGQFWS